MLTPTFTNETFKLSRPGNSVVALKLPEPGENPPKTVFTIPPHSTWTPKPHWHERYREFVQVKQGKARIVLDGKVKIVTPADGIQTIEKFVIHEFMRADIDAAAAGEGNAGDVIIDEWTEPGDGLKEVFFRNIISTIEQPAAFGRLHVLQILLVCAHYDNWDVMIPGRFAWISTHAVLSIVRGLGWLLDLRPWHAEFTPDRLQSIAKTGGASNSTKKSL